MAVEQYPHYLFAATSSESVQDEFGNWSDPATVENKLISKCREETNGRGSGIQVAGGTFHVFSSVVQLPKSCPKVVEGTTVFVANNADGSGLRVKGEVLKFDQSQLHSRLWI